MILYVAGLTLAPYARSADTLSLEPAHLLPEYTRSTLATNTLSSFALFGDVFVIHDFNHDGRLDAAVVVQGTDDDPWPLGMCVLLQAGDGSFARKAEYTFPGSGATWDLVVGDYNEDGHADLVADDLGNDLMILLGKGDGTFTEPAYLGLAAPGFPITADLNGDGHLDLLAGKLDGVVGYFAGMGDGTFVTVTDLDTQAIANHRFFKRGQIMVGDVNRDGKSDVVVASPPDANTDTGNLDVFLGEGNGSFRPVIRQEGVAVFKGALGDFNGDGMLDYAGGAFYARRIEIWLGHGDGRFQRVGVTSMPDVHPDVIQAGDLNSDGILDLIVSGEGNDFFAASLGLLLGKGDGSFQARQTITPLPGALAANVGPRLLDYNSDGLLDLLSIAEFRAPRGNALAVALNPGVKRDPGRGFLVGVRGGSTGPRVLEGSTDWVQWTPLATNGAPAGVWPVVDPAAGQPRRFYRTRQP